MSDLGPDPYRIRPRAIQSPLPAKFPLMPSPVAIQLNHLNFAYAGGGTVLKDISFAATPGERLAVLGPSGSGKSTLLLHLNALLPDPPLASADPATVIVDELPATAKNANQIRRRVGFLFQNPEDQLFGSTVAQDVAFGPLNLGLNPKEVQERVEQALDDVGLGSFADRDTIRLSLGERKRACLAGVLACHPGCLVLDEPFANLDPRGRRRLTNILANFDGTLILATHDLTVVRELTDRILVLDAGELCADAATQEILDDEQLLGKHGLIA
tara:strand:+ start:247 stop:1059 length:813 start_codon:yes stop_codon:yes gene_type:complete